MLIRKLLETAEPDHTDLIGLGLQKPTGGTVVKDLLFLTQVLGNCFHKIILIRNQKETIKQGLKYNRLKYFLGLANIFFITYLISQLLQEN